MSTSRFSLTAALAAFLIAFGGETRADDTATAAAVPAVRVPTVTVVRVAETEIVETVIVAGSLVAREEVLVAAEVDGLAIMALLVEAGAVVEKGQVLARLAKAPLEAQLAQMAAQIARADAAMAQSGSQIAEADAIRVESSRALKRARTLKKSGFASDEKVDQTLSANRVSEARVAAAEKSVAVAAADRQAAEAQMRELTWRLARTEVRAPVAGIIARRNAKIGQIASMAGEPLFRLIADGDIELEAEVADIDMPKVAAGQKVEVVPAGFRAPIVGTVRLVSPEIDPVTRLGKVRIALAASRPLSTGAFARATLIIEVRHGLTIPLSALSYGEGNAFTQVVVEGVVRTRPLQVGLVTGAAAEVTSGLEAGESVVARAGGFLRDGDRVTAVEPAAATP